MSILDNIDSKTLKKEYKAGMGIHDLAVKYDCTNTEMLDKLRGIGAYKRTKKYYFTEDDRRFLEEHYPLGHKDLIMERFDGIVGINSIRSYCSKYGITADYFGWTKEEEEILTKHYSNRTERNNLCKEMYERFNGRHTMAAIQTKVQKMGLAKDWSWTEEEVQIMKDYYEASTVPEMLERLPNRTYDAIAGKARSMHIISKYRQTEFWSDSQYELLCKYWKEKTDAELSEIIGKGIASIKNKRWFHGMLRFGHYASSSYDNLLHYLRGKIWNWKSDSMKACNYQCVLTGDSNFEIHHAYSFSRIFADMIDEHNEIVVRPSIKEYSTEELQYIESLFLAEHDKHPLGICVRKDLHMQFHSIYGKYNNLEQWKEFEKNYRNRYLLKSG